jgi:hypothetical protein
MSRLLSLTILAAMALAAPARAEMVNFKASISGAQEVPAKTTDGKGDALATLDTKTKMLSYTVTYTGLSGAATAGHIHGPAAAGANAGVLVPFASAASPISGTATLTDVQIADLIAGKMYVNIHTAANPGGEIRGQLTK